MHVRAKKYDDDLTYALNSLIRDIIQVEASILTLKIYTRSDCIFAAVYRVLDDRGRIELLLIKLNRILNLISYQISRSMRSKERESFA